MPVDFFPSCTQVGGDEEIPVFQIGVAENHEVVCKYEGAR